MLCQCTLRRKAFVSIITATEDITVNGIPIKFHINCRYGTILRTAIYVTIDVGRACVSITTLRTYIQRGKSCNACCSTLTAAEQHLRNVIHRGGS